MTPLPPPHAGLRSGRETLGVRLRSSVDRRGHLVFVPFIFEPTEAERHRSPLDPRVSLNLKVGGASRSGSGAEAPLSDLGKLSELKTAVGLVGEQMTTLLMMKRYYNRDSALR